MLSALGTVFLYIGSATNILDLTSVAIASLLIFFAVMEMGTPYQYLIYGVTSLLAVLLLPDKANDSEAGADNRRICVRTAHR